MQNYSNRPQPKQPINEGGELKCPECGSPLVLRKGQYGDFFGCTNYDPNTKTGCQYKISAKKVVGAIPTSQSTPVPAAATPTRKTGKNPDTVLAELRKTYDEVIAEFADVFDMDELIKTHPEVLHSIVATAFIEKNKRG